MKKKAFSFILIIATLISYVSTFGLSVSALTVSDEGILPFEDVRANHWFADAAEFCYVNDVINGMNEYTFAPNGKLTRAQFVTMLANIEGVDLTAYSTNQFTDVKSSHWYYKAVAWAYENGIVSGTSVNKFSPNMQINRETLSRIMTLYMTNNGYSVSVDSTALNKYTDKGSISSWATNGMKYMVSSGLISGMSEQTVAPKGVVTRAQAARILMLFIQDYLYAGHEHIFSEATCTESAVCEFCGMINGLPEGHYLTSEYSCKNGAICTVCNNYIAPSDARHDWLAATCKDAKTCRICLKTIGEALGHEFIDIYCNRCGVYYADTLPKRLNDLFVIDSSFYNVYFNYKYIDDSFIDSFGNVYDGVHFYNGLWEKKYSIHNLEKEYTLFKGSIVATPNTLSGSKYCIDIYVDDVLKFSINDFTKTSGKVDFSIDVKFGSQLKIIVYDGGGETDVTGMEIGIVDAQLLK